MFLKLLYVCIQLQFGDSPASSGVILPHALDEVDFLWHLGSGRTGHIPQPKQEQERHSEHFIKSGTT